MDVFAIHTFIPKVVFQNSSLLIIVLPNLYICGEVCGNNLACQRWIRPSDWLWVLRMLLLDINSSYDNLVFKSVRKTSIYTFCSIVIFSNFYTFLFFYFCVLPVQKFRIESCSLMLALRAVRLEWNADSQHFVFVILYKGYCN